MLTLHIYPSCARFGYLIVQPDGNTAKGERKTMDEILEIYKQMWNVWQEKFGPVAVLVSPALGGDVLGHYNK